MNSKELTLLRKHLKMKQLDFCDKIGISQSYLSEMEKGKKPIPDYLYNKITDIFGCDALLAIESEAVPDRNQNENSTASLKAEIEELKAEIVALKAENSVLREIVGLGVKKESKSAS